jgi:hypothetical protein
MSQFMIQTDTSKPITKNPSNCLLNILETALTQMATSELEQKIYALEINW